MGSGWRLLGYRQCSGANVMRAILLALIVFVVLLLNCQAHAPQATLLPDGGDACNAMCANERAISASTPCTGFTGGPSPAGTTCEAACHAQDPIYNLHSVCVAEAQSCAAMKACYTAN
jgi:hypothetical protein